jgi:hypothetical protein
MGVARQAPAAATRHLVIELKADGEDKGQDKLHECLAIVNQLEVSGCIVEIDGDRAVFAYRFCALSHVSPSVEMAIGADETSCG